jgi:hypothetical protein
VFGASALGARSLPVRRPMPMGAERSDVPEERVVDRRGGSCDDKGPRGNCIGRTGTSPLAATSLKAIPLRATAAAMQSDTVPIDHMPRGARHGGPA